jgi:hypothetical protein
MFSLKYPSPELEKLSIESSVAREINFGIVIRNFADKKARSLKSMWTIERLSQHLPVLTCKVSYEFVLVN